MVLLALVASLVTPVAASAPRELVYTYAVESYRTDDVDHPLGVDKADPGGGGTFFIHNIEHNCRCAMPSDSPQRRSGSATIEIERTEPDGGVVLAVQPEVDASGGPITCVAFADTSVVCDPSRNVPPEILTLLALFGKGFVDPSRLDAARHWHVEPQGAYGTSIDYTIVGTAGTLLDIDEAGLRTGRSGRSKTTISGTIEYDTARSLPTQLAESTVEKSERGTIAETISTNVSVKLQSVLP